ncbi:hypothetical protein AALA56_04390 [Streptococcus hyointestinalis]|uniref:hypothetical protein n=1 Tax=Streptococcus hyointestinalis TaxID=1337 RepID=UPI0035199E7A
MTKKMGRPLKGSEPRNKSLAIRLTQTEFDDITKLSQEMGISKAEVVVSGIELLKER